MCYCGIEADNHHLLELLAAYDKKLTKLTMYFTINLAFTNYLELMPNIMEQLTLNRDKQVMNNPCQYTQIFHIMTIHCWIDQAN